MARDLDGILEVADPEIVSGPSSRRRSGRSTTATRACASGSTTCSACSRTGSRGPPASHDEDAAVVIGLDVTATGAGSGVPIDQVYGWAPRYEVRRSCSSASSEPRATPWRRSRDSPRHIHRQGPPPGRGHRRAVRVLRARGRAPRAGARRRPWSGSVRRKDGPLRRAGVGFRRPTRRRASARGCSTWRSSCPTGPSSPARSRRVDRAGLAPHRRIRPPGQRGAVPARPRWQRHRDLPRPPARPVGRATTARSRWRRSRSTSTTC